MRRRLLILPGLVLASIVATPFALLDGGLLPLVTNLDPGVFELKFTKARWVPPLSASVEGLELKIQSEGNRVRVGVDSATTTFKPLAMLDGTIAFDDTTARGVTLAVQLPEPATGTPEKRLAPMEDFAPPNTAPRPVWKVSITNIKEAQARELWIDGFHYEGELVATGGFQLAPKETLTVSASHVTIDGGVLTMPNGLQAKFEPSEVSAELRAMPLDIPAHLEMLRAVDAAVKLKVHTPNLNYFNSVLFNELPEVRLLRGAGGIAVNAKVKGGVVENGSELNVARRELGVRVPYFDIIGHAEIDVTAGDGKAIARVSLPRFSVLERDGEEGREIAEGRHCTLVATVGTLDLTAVRAVDVSIDLKEAVARDLTFLNRFIPDGSGITVGSGNGDLQVDAQLSTKTQRAKGKLTLHARDMLLQNRGARITGAAEVIGILDSFDLKRRHFDLTGSNIKLAGVNVVTKRRTYKDVTLSAVAPKALFAPDGEHPVSATIAVGVSNLQPLMGILSANVELPDIAVALLNIPDVAASADLDVHKNEIRLSPVVATATAIRVDAQMTLQETTQKEMEPHGAALVRAGLLTIGLGFDGGIVSPVLFDAPRWYGVQTDGGVP